MKKMSELKDNLRGIKCERIKECFNFLKAQNRKPRIVETPTALFVRVTIDGKRYDYSGTTGAWTETQDRGRRGSWRESESVQDFYTKAVNMSNGIYPPTQAQAKYLSALVRRTGLRPHTNAFVSFTICANEIERLKKHYEKEAMAS